MHAFRARRCSRRRVRTAMCAWPRCASSKRLIIACGGRVGESSPVARIDLDAHFEQNRRRNVRALTAASRNGALRTDRRATDRASRRLARDKSHAQSCFSFHTKSSRTHRRRHAAHCTMAAGGMREPFGDLFGHVFDVEHAAFVESVSGSRRATARARATRCRASARRMRARPRAGRCGRPSRAGWSARSRRSASFRRRRRRSASTRVERAAP